MKQHILVVEDSPTQAMRAKLLLENAGYSVDVAENGKQGLEMALAAPPELVVADITMPVMDGNEMTLRLRSNPKTENIPILMLTANDQPLDVIRGLEVGADHFITKPYNDDFLVIRVKELFKQLELARQGQLPQQKQVAQFAQEIVITHSREQILQALLQTTARLVNCQAMALLITTPDGKRLLFPISFAPLEGEMIDRIAEHLVTVLARVHSDSQRILPTHITPVVVEETRFSSSITGNLLASFTNTPLIVDGQVVGILGVYSTIPDAFDTQNVGYLFNLGQKAAEALSRVKAR